MLSRNSTHRGLNPARRSVRLASAALVAFAVCLGPATPARAENKDMVRLQAQVQALADAVARLQQSNDERMGVLKDLVQQTADSVNKMTATVTNLQQQMANNHDAAAKGNDQLAGQIQALNDSLDELKARMQRMEKTLTDVQSQQAQMSAVMTSAPAGGGAVAPAAVPPAGASPAPVNAPPSASVGPHEGAPLPMPDEAAPAAPGVKAPPTAGPSVGAMYRSAYSDYMAGKEQLATSEFNDLIKAYPDDNLSGNAYFYLGEMDLRANRPGPAIKNYDRVIEQYPNNAKIPAAHLHKAQALKQMQQAEASTRELRALIARFPASPEAAQAKSRLAAHR